MRLNLISFDTELLRFTSFSFLQMHLIALYGAKHFLFCKDEFSTNFLAYLVFSWRNNGKKHHRVFVFIEYFILHFHQIFRRQQMDLFPSQQN